MILSDRSIRENLASGRLSIYPLAENAIQPASVDIRLSNVFRVFGKHLPEVIDVYNLPAQGLTYEIEIAAGQSFILHPNEFVLGATIEVIELSDDLLARLEGRSSLGRLGLLIHSTAGFIDPGFRGSLTLELVNVAPLPIVLYPGMSVAQVSFLEMTSESERPYGTLGLGSKYQGQKGPTESRFQDERPPPQQRRS